MVVKVSLKGREKGYNTKENGKKFRFYKKIKKFEKSLFKRLTGVCKFDIINRLCKYACMG